MDQPDDEVIRSDADQSEFSTLHTGGGAFVGGNVSVGGDFVGRDKIVHNVNQVIQQAISAAEEARQAQELTRQRLAEGVQIYAQQLAAIAQDESDSEEAGPYRGLLAYTLRDAEIFYGRTHATRDLLALMRRGRLTVLQSESGAGKSSLLHAGIAPHLLAEGALPVIIRSYNRPPDLVIKQTFLPNLAQTPEFQNTSLRAFLRPVTVVIGAGATLILVLDQFEEFFTLLPNEAERSRFVAELADCLEDESLPVRWVLALRSEFFGDLATFRPRIRNPFQNDYRLNRLTRDEAQEVIEKPADRYKIAYEPALIARLLDDLSEGSVIHPPQLQLVCLALYQTLMDRLKAEPNHPRIISVQIYQEEGGAAGILRGHLNRVLQRSLPTRQERDLARRLLVEMVSSDQRRIRRTRSDLAATLATGIVAVQTLDEVLDTLVEDRLLNVEVDEETDDRRYELAHDYLLSEIQLSPEVQAQKAAQELLNQETDAYRRFGTLLDRNKFDIINSQRKFLRLDARAEELLTKSKTELARRARQIFMAGTTAVLILLAAFAFSVYQLNETREALAAEAIAVAQTEIELARAEQAEATARTEQARAERNALQARIREIDVRTQSEQAAEVFDPSLVLLLALEAVNEAVDEETRHAALETNPQTISADEIPINPDADELLHRAVFDAQGMGWRMTLPQDHHTGEVHSAVFSPDGSMILTASADQTARLWDVATGRQLLMLVGHDDAVFDAQFSPADGTIATTGQDGTIRFWNAESGEELRQFPAHDQRVRSLAFSPDGSQLVTASQDGTARVFDAETGTKVLELTHGDDLWILAAAFSPDGSRIVTTSNDETARLWDAQTGQSLAILSHDSWVRNAAFTPDGSRLVTVSQDGRVLAWTLPATREFATPPSTEFPPHLFRTNPRDVNDVAFSDDGKLLVTVAHAGQIYLRDAASGSVYHSLVGHNDDEGVTAVDFSPDGDRIVTASSDHTVRIWNVLPDNTLHEQRTIGGHTDEVRDAAFAPDGSMLATAGSDLSIWLWDVETGEPIQALAAHTGTVQSVAFSPNGEWLVSGGESAAVYIWDLTSGEVITSLEGFTGTVMSVDVSPDGNRVVAGGEPAMVRIWDVNTGNEVSALTGHTATINSVVYSPDGLRILTASDDGSALLWNADTGDEVAEYRHHNFGIRTATLSRNGRRLATGGRDDSAIVWNVATGTVEFTIEDHDSDVESVAFSPDGEYLITASSDGSARIWQLDNLREARKLLGHDGPVHAALFSPDGATIATAGADRTARLWNHGATREQREFEANTNHQRFTAFSPDDSLIVSAGQDSESQLWNASTGEELHTFPHERAVWSAEFSPDGDRVLTASLDGTIGLWNVQSGEGITVTVPVSNVRNVVEEDDLDDLIGLTYAGFSTDGSQFVTVGNDRIVRLWSAEAITVTHVFSGHREMVIHAAFQPTGTRLATGSADGTAILWDLDSRQPIRAIAAHGDWVWFVSFSPDGTRLATAGGDGTARIWNVESGEQELILALDDRIPVRSVLDGLVRTVQFSPDGRLLLTAGEDQIARIWDAADGRLLRQFIGHRAEVWYAGFSHDGRTVLTAGFDGTLRLWDVRVEDTVARAHSLIQRDPPIFTSTERQTYRID